MNAGEIVQVQQDAKHWIYAVVAVPNADGSALVQVRHPGNVDHDRLLVFPASKIRTKEALEKQLESGLPDVPVADRAAELQSLRVQLAYLS